MESQAGPAMGARNRLIGLAKRLKNQLQRLRGNSHSCITDLNLYTPRIPLHRDSNAEGGITVAVRGDTRGVELRVSDTGMGIAPEALEMIFEPFRQADESITRSHGGTGLGLHIVKRLLELLGGTVTVESEVGRGSTFRVWVPRGSPISPEASSETVH